MCSLTSALKLGLNTSKSDLSLLFKDSPILKSATVRLSSLEHKPPIHSFVHPFIHSFIKSLFSTLCLCLVTSVVNNRHLSQTALEIKERRAHDRKSTGSSAGFTSGHIQQLTMSPRTGLFPPVHSVILGVDLIQMQLLGAVANPVGYLPNCHPPRLPLFSFEHGGPILLRYQHTSSTPPECGC